MHALNPERIMDLAVVAVASLTWEMFDFGNNRVPRSEYSDAAVRYLKSMQTPDGDWPVIESRRPPMNSGVYQAAALAVYALRNYGPPAEQADTEKAIARAAAWLEAAAPSNTQDRAFRLLGLAWANANPAAIAAAAKSLAASQRADGGWNQLASLGSDAYATGQALYALNSAGGMPVSDPVFARGVKYLLNTQAADGSWYVKSRSIWLQPYFDSGFPYGQDQWISAAATSWASMALALTVDARHPPVRETQSLANPNAR
jgi:squalene cyclase